MSGLHQTWHRGDSCNFMPTKAKLKAMPEHYLLKGLTPIKPFIKKADKISAFGSCFASEILEYLTKKGYSVNNAGKSRVHLFSHGSGMVSSFVLREQIEWALLNKPQPEGMWFFAKDQQSAKVNEEIRLATRQHLLNTNVFILTLGLSEIWFSKEHQRAFWKAVPQDVFDPKKHTFRVATFKENKNNIARVTRLLKRHNPRSRIIWTVSPIPLGATFRPQACIVSNSASKALLRSALDEYLRHEHKYHGIHYWPSYEIATEYFTDPWQKDRRHIKTHVRDYIMNLFSKYYLV